MSRSSPATSAGRSGVVAAVRESQSTVVIRLSLLRVSRFVHPQEARWRSVGPLAAATRTYATRPEQATPTASPRSRSTGPRCATPSGRRRCSSSRTPSTHARDDVEVGVIILTGEGDRRPSARAATSASAATTATSATTRSPSRHRPAQRARPADPDPPPAQAGRRDGRRLRDRRRPRAARRLRPHDRRRQRPLRPDRAEGRQLRRRLRRRLPGAHRRPEEGARDLVPVPPVRRPAGARHGPRQHGRAARRARGRDRRSGAARC